MNWARLPGEVFAGWLAAALSVSGCDSEGSTSKDGGALHDGEAGGARGDATRGARADGGRNDGAGGRLGIDAETRMPADAATTRGADGARTGGANSRDGASALDAEPDGAGACADGVTLRCTAGPRFVGSAVRFNALSTDPQYPIVLGREFSSVTPEDDAKWTPLEPQRGVWSFDKLDAIASAAEAHGQVIHGHTFVWYYEIPSWAAALSTSELSAALHEHVTKTVLRYKGRVRSWDVVNEAIDDSSLGLRSGIVKNLGVAGLADAFKWVHDADPTALLFYNDYGIEDLTPKARAVYDLVQQLVAAGAPLDGVGIQSHLTTLAYPSAEGLRANMRRFAALGLRVRISELDARTVSVPVDRATRLAQERVLYQTVGGACASEPSCDGVTSWGFTDAYSWIDGAFAPDDPLEFDESYRSKPAYDGLLRGLSGILPKAGPNLFVNGDCSSITGWKAFGGGSLSSAANGRTGAACRVTGRTVAYYGPSQSLLGKVASGDTIAVTAWVRASAANAPVYASLKITAGGKDTYQSIASATATNTGWTLLTGNAAQGWTTAPTDFELYFEGPDPGVDLLVDDVTVNVLSAG